MSLSWNTHTRSCTHTHIFPVTFSCGERTTQTSPASFVGRRSDALLLRRWMDGCHTEVKAVLSSLHHSALAVGATENSGQHYYFQTAASSPYITGCYATLFIHSFSFSPPSVCLVSDLWAKMSLRDVFHYIHVRHFIFLLPGYSLQSWGLILIIVRLLIPILKAFLFTNSWWTIT